MADKKITRQLSIFINGKEVKNSLGGIGREIAKVKRQLKEANDPADIKKYKAELDKLGEKYGEVKKEIDGTTSKLSSLKGALKPIGPLLLATFSVTAILAFFKTIATQISVLRKLKGTIYQITRLQGESLDQATSKIQALSETFDADSKKMTEAAQNLSQQMSIDFSEALDLIKQGYLDGADANGDFLDKVREYPALLNEAGLSAEQSIALMTQEIKQGIYSDKGVDAIKEANLRLREMTPAAESALNAIGISSANLQKELTEGSITTFEAIQKVSERLDTLPPQSKIVGQAIADIFGGPGEDAGLRYLSNLHKIDLTTNDLLTTTNKYTLAKELELKANKDLNDVWVKLTGVGSTLNIMYSGLKSGLASLLGTLTGVKDEAIEAKNAFDDQAKKVVALDKSLGPLTQEYENLRSKSKLSEKEQARLKSIIEQIGKIVPSAITEFDKYGNALDISTDKAKEFVKTQKALLKYRNVEVIEEETEKLQDLNTELTKINSTLNNRNDKGDIVKVSHTFTKTDRLITTETKVSDREIARLQARAQEIEQLQLGVQASLDEHTGDYLTKFVEAEEKKTEKTDVEISNRKALEKTAHDLKIKNIETFSEEQLQVEIAKTIEANNIRGNEAKKAEEAKANARKQVFEKSEKELNDLIKKLNNEKLLNQKEGFDRELLAVDQKYNTLKEKFVLSEEEKTNLTLQQIEERENQIQELEDAKAREKQELKNQRDAEFREELKAIEEENRLLDEEAKLELEAQKATTDEERELAVIAKAQYIANKQLEIEKKKELDKVKAYENAEQIKQGIRNKYDKLQAKLDSKFNRAKSQADKQALENERILNSQRAQAYADMFGGIAKLLGEHTAAGKAAAIAQATINTYQGITEVWTAKSVLPEPFATAAKVVSTATVLASGLGAVKNITSTKAPKFFYGGSTGDTAIYNDEYGPVTGVVHKNEWVAPEFMTESPRYAPTIQWLEKERKKELGQFFDGGNTSLEDAESSENNTDNEAFTPQSQDNTELMLAITRLNTNIENGIKSYSVRDYEDFLNRKELDEEHEQIFNNTRNS